MESLLALGGLLAFALLCVAVSAVLPLLRRRKKPPPPRRLLVHSINDDRCTGCDACVSVCPTDVLELVANKSRVIRFDDCIQCEQCALVCPTTALVMHPQGTAAPTVRVADTDEFYRAASGLYLIGEAAGKPLVKNASNLGRVAVEHLAGERRPLPSRRGVRDVLDVLIVGSGPGGLSAALSCAEHGLRYTVVEKDELVASTIARWPKGKACMAEPYDVRCLGRLPVFDAGRDQLLAAWRARLDQAGVRVSLRESVEDVTRGPDGVFAVRTSRRRLRAANVVLAIGTRGRPRRLGVPGEHLPHVAPLLDDPERHRGQRVLVVGGGDSAVEAAVALGDTAAHVMLSYRGRALSRCSARNRQRLDEAVQAGRVEVRFSSQVAEIAERAVVLRVAGRGEQIACDAVFVCIGGDAPVQWLASLGVRFVERPHQFQRGPTDLLVESLVGACDELPSAPVPLPRRASRSGVIGGELIELAARRRPAPPAPAGRSAKLSSR